jgi:hypothetical protein
VLRPDFYLKHGWVVAGTAPAEPDSDELVIPDGDPDKSWKNEVLVAYAEREGIDLDGATKKDDLLAAIAKGDKVTPPAGE